jgi:uncharacterized protein YkwD
VVLGLFGSSALVSKCSPVPAPVASTTTALSTADCVTRTNAFRVTHGLRALKVESHVGAAAKRHSTYQAKIRTMTHNGSAGSNAKDRMVAAGYTPGWWGENVAAGQKSCATVVTAWIGSPHHRENMLNPHFTVIGMGAVRGSNGAIYWTMDLASPN